MNVTDMTLNRLIEEFHQLTSKHKFIKSSFYGDFLNTVESEKVQHLSFLFNAVVGNISEKFITFNFTIAVMDKVFKDQSNRVDVESDSVQILSDIFSVITKSDRWLSFSRLQGATAPIQKFIGKGEDQVTGWSMTMQLGIMRTSGLCDLPIEGYDYEGAYTAYCAGVRIFEDGILVRVEPSGGRFDYSTAEDPHDVTVNGQEFFTQVTGDSNVPVVDSADAPRGSKVGPNWKISDGVVHLKNSDGDTFSNVSVKAEEDKNHTVGDGTVQILNSETTVLYTKVVKAQGNASQIITDSTVNVKDSSGTTLYAKTVKAQETTDQVVADGSVILKDTDGVTIQTYTNKAQENKSVTIPIIYIRPVADGNELTSYLTGDVGWIYANDPDPYVPASIGITAFLDPSNPMLLLHNNAFGHKNRFTGINGGYYDYVTAQYKLANGTVSDQATTFGTAAASTSYLIDHHTGLGWKWNVQGSNTWATQVSNADALTHAGFSDWRLPNRKQLATLLSHKITNIMGILPFSSSASLKTATPTIGSETTMHHQLTYMNWLTNRADGIHDAAYFVRRHYT